MENSALFTDFYQLAMAYGYWKKGLEKREAAFYLSFRKKPFGGSFALFAGLDTVINFIRDFRFQKRDIDYLRSIKEGRRQFFEEPFLNYLENLRLSCDVDAMEEGTPVFPGEPLLRVRGPILQAQILESALLNIVNFQTLIATKASRICFAAFPNPVIEFGMRRAQGFDGALSASRASFIGGCLKTSHVLAGQLFQIPISGTMAHSWIMAFGNETEAFENFFEVMPENCVLLVDTYDSLEGTKKAICVAKKMKEKGGRLFAVRLDSGDLAELSCRIRKMLDDEGLEDVKIIASNELDEYLIRDLRLQEAKIDIWGVGTNLVAAKDQSALDGVYKLSAMRDEEGNWQNKMKISDQLSKVTTPGILQVRRFFSIDGGYAADAIFDEKKFSFSSPIFDFQDPTFKKNIGNLEFKDLLVPIFRKGRQVYDSPALEKIQKRGETELSKFNPAIRRFLNPDPYFVGLEGSLHETKYNLLDKLRFSIR